MSILPVFVLATTAIFLLALAVHSSGRLKFCAVCVTIGITWLSLLIARLLGYPVNPILIGVLMGECVVGLYHLIEKRAPPSWQIFRWPYMITLTVAVYLVVGVRSGAWASLALLALIWIVWGGAYALRQYPSIKKITERLIACCRDW